jgi:hypothetical protein
LYTLAKDKYSQGFAAYLAAEVLAVAETKIRKAFHTSKNCKRGGAKRRQNNYFLT